MRQFIFALSQREFDVNNSTWVLHGIYHNTLAIWFFAKYLL